MIYYEWSDEFGGRLEELTGIESNYWKEYYDSKKDMCCQVIAEDDFILPFYIIKDRYTGNKIPIILGDVDFNKSLVLLDQKESYFTDNNLKIIENSRQDFILPLKSSFYEHKKSLERVSRCYNKCQHFTTILHTGMFINESFKPLISSYSEYWVSKDEDPIDFLHFFKCLKQIERISESYTIEIKHGLKTIALAYFEIYNNEVYWHETIRDVTKGYEKYSVGNYVLLKALEELCYIKKLPLNLGISSYDYKKHWHPVLKQVKGLRFIKDIS